VAAVSLVFPNSLAAMALLPVIITIITKAKLGMANIRYEPIAVVKKMATYRNRIVNQSLSTRDRKAMHTPTEDRFRYSAADQTSPYKSKTCQLSSLCLSNFLKDKELVEVIKHSRGTYETLTSEVTQNLRATVGQNSLKPIAKTEGLSTFSEKPKDQAAVARQHSTFTGRDSIGSFMAKVFVIHKGKYSVFVPRQIFYYSKPKEKEREIMTNEASQSGRPGKLLRQHEAMICVDLPPMSRRFELRFENQVLKCGPWTEGVNTLSANRPKLLIFFITGNTGFSAFYVPFTKALYSSTKRRFPVWVISHAGHADIYGLCGQAEYKLAFLRTHVPKEMKLVVTDSEAYAPELPITRRFLLSPAIERMTDSPIHFCAGFDVLYVPGYLLLKSWPEKIRSSMIRMLLRMINVESECSFLNALEPFCLISAASLGSQEMMEVVKTDNETIKEHVPKFTFYYDTIDGWCPKAESVQPTFRATNADGFTEQHVPDIACPCQLGRMAVPKSKEHTHIVNAEVQSQDMSKMSNPIPDSDICGT
ncbi:hypothetical protein EI555_010375, partial [Monodon monoceros]